MRTTKFVLAAILLVSVTANPEDTDCTEGGQYLPSATDCSDVRSEATCSLMYQESLVFPGAVNERPYECFLGADGRPDQDLKQMAVENCPQTCGYCCLTKKDAAYNETTPKSTTTSTTTTTTTPTPTVTDYDCTSGGRFLRSANDCLNNFADSACAAIYSFAVASGSSANKRPSKCFLGADGRPNAELKRAALNTCPRTCGYCCKTKNAGVPVGGCVDTSPSCTKKFCVTIGMEDFVAKHCKRTCERCNSRPTAGPPVIRTTPAAKINKCIGLHDHRLCPMWVKKNFCTTYLPVSARRETCPISCGLC